MQITGTELKNTELGREAGALATKAAHYAGKASGYLQGRSTGEIFDDANRLIRRFPEHSLIAAAAAGLLLGAVLRRK